MPEASVAHRDDLEDGQMKQVDVEGTAVLLVRLDGQYHALGAHCTHYGAPLADGVLSGDRVVCPWHHACFNVRTGDLLEPPAFDALPRFDVRVEGDRVVVSVPEDAPDRRVASMARREEGDDRTLVVLGGGAAGLFAAEAAREAGYTGRLVMITREPYTPYDRPNCSKDYLQGEAPEEWMVLRDDAFYAERDIEVLTERTVAEVDVPGKVISFDDGDTLRYDTLILCTGGTPRRLDVPGAGLDGVHTLRSFDDSKTLLEKGKEAQRVVVVGSGFIGMEAAFSLRKLDCEVTVVAPGEVPFAGPFGERVGRMVQSIHEENGVRFRLGRKVRRIEGDGRVERVTLDDGTTLDADLVVAGVGVRPATDVLRGIRLGEDGSLDVDAYLRAADGLYAAGDVARFPDWRTGDAVRIEHWRLAGQHGRLAGLNAAGRPTAFRSVPFFWTAHFGTNLRYVGHAGDYDEVLFDGDPDDRDFIAYYVRGGAVRAALGVGRDQQMAALEELMRREELPSLESLRAGSVDLVAQL
ncbi:MAG: FAD-dependent oxidoreductase [Rhodothermales bacterium]|nr:FAD-dependent oxidoreductase [Rhodothermales bacterium]